MPHLIHPLLVSLLATLHTIPIVFLFLSVGIGSFIGNFRVGSFKLGGIAGSLLVAVILSQLNIPIDKSIGSVFFALFIYTVGFRSGPKLFASLGTKTLKELSLVIVLASTSLITIIVLARIFSLDKGTAAGITSGALTQSAMMGTATAALTKMHLSEAAIELQQSHVAIGYAVTYIFGSIGAIIMCTTVLPLLTRHSIRQDAQTSAFNVTEEFDGIEDPSGLKKAIPRNLPTNLFYQGVGIAIGLIIGSITAHPFGIPVTLGAGGGTMLSGLVFGWWQGKRPELGGISDSTATFLIQYGLAAFVATIGLNTGRQALHTIQDHGALIFALGCVITIFPMFVTMLYAWFILRYRNIAVLAGALAGARSSNPAFGQVLQAAGNNVPGVPFAITYAFANFILTLLGPVIIAII